MLELITVRNFKVLKDMELILSNLTVVAGINNMGKSSLIQILLLIRQSFEQNTLTKDGLLLNGRLISVGNGRDALSADAENEVLSVSLHWENNDQLHLELGRC
ncbi:AAA family ATPase [Desulfobacterales bacterium HSG2]|nr:AAA family ATPase [Desulfobacterales bacterium HSG2]